MKVQRAYVGSERTLVDTEGRVFVGGEWQAPASEVIPVCGTFSRWVDVPQAWLGFSPWFPEDRRS